MRLTIRDLLWLTVVALVVACCEWSPGNDPESKMGLRRHSGSGA